MPLCLEKIIPSLVNLKFLSHLDCAFLSCHTYFCLFAVPLHWDTVLFEYAFVILVWFLGEERGEESGELDQEDGTEEN